MIIFITRICLITVISNLFRIISTLYNIVFAGFYLVKKSGSLNDKKYVKKNK
jgi:hypothetical protein